MTRRHRLPARLSAFTLVELLVVVGLMALLISVLLPVLSRVRKTALRAEAAEAEQQRSAAGAGPAQVGDFAAAAGAVSPPPRLPDAHVTRLDADITLTPRLSVGAAEPESIYEAKFAATLTALPPPAAAGDGTDAEYEIELPLPPQIISLADLSAGGGGAARLRDGRLVWSGKLAPGKPTDLALTYTAVGKGLYTLQAPAGGVADEFRVALTANGSDVRLPELSLQPTDVSRRADHTLYTWDYRQLLFARPVVLDVLGIAPIDRLGELRWLGPLSVVLFGLLVGLITRALGADFDKWVLALILGTFTAAYPLMYFAQQFVPLRAAVGASAAVVLTIITSRSSVFVGPRVAVLGVALPAAAVMAVTLLAAVRPNLQGILLTGVGMCLFILAMDLMPRLKQRDPGSGARGGGQKLSPAPV